MIGRLKIGDVSGTLEILKLKNRVMITSFI